MNLLDYSLAAAAGAVALVAIATVTYLEARAVIALARRFPVLATSAATTLMILGGFAAATPAAHADVQGKIVVHTVPEDVDGDGGSWAWGQGRDTVHPVIRAAAPSKAATFLASLHAGDEFMVGGNGVDRGLYTVQPGLAGDVLIQVKLDDGVARLSADLSIPMRRS